MKAMAVNLEKIPQAVEVLVQMGARRVILFGSAAESCEAANDIDLGVEGIPLNRILAADAALMDILRQPFDLLAREQNPAMFEIISRYGKRLYG
jgi:predicted nucleotidyltransferase